MLHYLIMCRSLTYAQRASAALERAGITAVVTRAPLELSSGGCGYCMKVAERRFHQSLRVLETSALPHGRLYHEGLDGTYAEVAG